MSGERPIGRWLIAGMAWLTVAVAMDGDQQSRVLAFAVKRFGAESGARLKPWFGLLQGIETLNEIDKLQRVNSFFNRVPNENDDAHWGARDYWASPVELLASNGGDCEDFALAKYFTLRELGVSDERLRLTYAKVFLRETGQIQSHMVLTYHTAPGAEPLVLDNLTDAIKPASRRPELTPTYSFNAVSLWFARERQRGRHVADVEAPQVWRDLRARMLHLDEVK